MKQGRYDVDPDTALNALIEAAMAADVAAFNEAADALATWLERGGFAPTDPRWRA